MSSLAKTCLVGAAFPRDRLRATEPSELSEAFDELEAGAAEATPSGDQPGDKTAVAAESHHKSSSSSSHHHGSSSHASKGKTVAKTEKSTAASNKKKDDTIDKLLAQFK